jgi:hypothetical protein
VQHVKSWVAYKRHIHYHKAQVNTLGSFLAGTFGIDSMEHAYRVAPLEQAKSSSTSMSSKAIHSRAFF